MANGKGYTELQLKEIEAARTKAQIQAEKEAAAARSKALQQMQSYYGAVVTTPTTQLRYGPVETTPPITVTPLYGAVVPEYGAHVVTDIDITYDQLEENISTLKKSISTLKSSWNNTTKRNISAINNSWAGKDCAAYTTKLTQMDSKVQNTIDALELLCSTYEKARDMIKESQTTVSNAVDNM